MQIWLFSKLFILIVHSINCIVHLTLYISGLDVATCGVANATSFYLVATKFSRLVASLAPKIGDFLLWENVH